MLLSLADEWARSRSGRGVVVAILDSGIHAGHPHVGGVSAGISFATDDDADVTDRLGHGTAVAAAIHEKSSDAALVAVKIFDRRLATSPQMLAQAIIWAAAHGSSIINLSVGTTNPAHAATLAEAVAGATARGSLVVSARSANGVDCWPGALRDVIGVLADPEIDRNSCDIATTTDGAILVRAAPFPRPIPNVPPERNLSGVSFAVANTSGILARLVEARGGDSAGIPRELTRRAAKPA